MQYNAQILISLTCRTAIQAPIPINPSVIHTVSQSIAVEGRKITQENRVLVHRCAMQTSVPFRRIEVGTMRHSLNKMQCCEINEVCTVSCLRPSVQESSLFSSVPALQEIVASMSKYYSSKKIHVKQCAPQAYRYGPVQVLRTSGERRAHVSEATEGSSHQWWYTYTWWNYAPGRLEVVDTAKVCSKACIDKRYVPVTEAR